MSASNSLRLRGNAAFWPLPGTLAAALILTALLAAPVGAAGAVPAPAGAPALEPAPASWPAAAPQEIPDGIPEGEVGWLRDPAISPDGATLVFSYQGDLWRVSAQGGKPPSSPPTRPTCCSERLA